MDLKYILDVKLTRLGRSEKGGIKMPSKFLGFITQ